MIFDRATENTIQCQLLICVSHCVMAVDQPPFYANHEHTFTNRLIVGTHEAVHLEFRNTVIRPLMFKVNRDLVFI